MMNIKDIPMKSVYVKAWKFASQNPTKLIKHFNWTRGIVTGEEYARECTQALMNRINCRGGIEFKGRKFDSDYQRTMIQASNFLNHPRLIIDWLPKDLEKRFAHRLRKNLRKEGYDV